MQYLFCTDSRDTAVLEAELLATGADGLIVWIGYWRGGNRAAEAVPVAAMCKRLGKKFLLRLVPSRGYKPTAAESAAEARKVRLLLEPHIEPADREMVPGNEPTEEKYGCVILRDKAGKDIGTQQWVPDEYVDRVFLPIAKEFRDAGWRIILTPMSIKADGRNKIDGSPVVGTDNYLRTFFRRGCGAYLSKLNIHPYQDTAAGQVKYVKRMIAIAAEFGVVLPVVITEWCLNAWGGKVAPNFDAEMRKLPALLAAIGVVMCGYFIDRGHAESGWGAYLFDAAGKAYKGFLNLFREFTGWLPPLDDNKPAENPPANSPVPPGVPAIGVEVVRVGKAIKAGKPVDVAGDNRSLRFTGLPAGTCRVTGTVDGVAFTATPETGWRVFDDVRLEGDWKKPRKLIATAYVGDQPIAAINLDGVTINKLGAVAAGEAK